ncbi:MAG: DUF1028 domain-containing protein [Gemmatimonadetes bacterium]|nr:DUF1028 domain-containing protein [Gemmatimonadota bacterium]NIO32148.1 DUF1028 domain-containing protein [Gemmatimonadota bacterium]
MMQRSKATLHTTAVLALGLAAVAPACGPEPGTTLPPPASFAILAHDHLTGEYGVAAASTAPLIGMNLEFFDPEAGGVVVLGRPFLQLNETVLIALQDGMDPGTAIAVGLAADLDRESRQVLAITPEGAAAFTGNELEGHAAHKTGEHFVVAGHQLANADVLLALEEAFQTTDGPLADRLLTALGAARDAGGEEDGSHSAALVVVGPGARFATRDRLVDLRIDFVPGDAVAALVELRAQVDSAYGIVRQTPPPPPPP